MRALQVRFYVQFLPPVGADFRRYPTLQGFKTGGKSGFEHRLTALSAPLRPSNGTVRSKKGGVGEH